MAYFKGEATFTPAAAAHTAGDVIGVKASLGTCEGGHYKINSASARINSATLYDADLTLHLFNASPTTIADADPFTIAAADRASYLGSIALGTAVDLVDTQYVRVNGLNMQVDLGTGTLYGFLVSAETGTPEAVGFVVTVFAERV